VTTPPVQGGRPGLRELKKQRTRVAIQDAALDLIARQGYDATTCEQIAAAAEVSPATFFRYFPTKEDVVLQDDYDPLMAAAVAARPRRERPFQAVRRALGETLTQLPEQEMTLVHERTRLLLSVPALRARTHEQLEAARAALADVLAVRMGLPSDDLAVQAVAAACAAAVSVGVERWARDGGRLGDHIDAALSALG
jgi:AcrR family transcriptional regulator